VALPGVVKEGSSLSAETRDGSQNTLAEGSDDVPAAACVADEPASFSSSESHSGFFDSSSMKMTSTGG
jgi:hypothetical protein